MKKLKVKIPRPDVVPLRLDAENGEFWRGEERLRLSRKPFAMLRLLVERRPNWVSKDDFYNVIWKPKDEDVMDWTFTTYAHEIRKALGDETSPHRYVETGVNRGYRFIGIITDSNQLSQGLETKPEALPTPPPRPKFKITPNPQPPLPYVVGRETELGRLHKWLGRALGGERQLIFITGEPGIGKTTLVRSFLREVATNGTAVIGRGQCIEHYGSGEAYLPVLEAIGRLARDPRGNFLVEWMKHNTPTWLIQMPTLLSPADLEEMRRKVQGATRERMLREMSEGIEVLTEQIPFILVLEDLHWSDASTLDLLSSLARRTEPARLLIIGTYRPEEGLTEGHPLRAIIQELQGHGQCQLLALPLLSEADVNTYLQQRFLAATLPTRLPEVLYRTTDGSPLFLTAVVEDLLDRSVITQIDGRWVLHGQVDDIATQVPVSIRQLLTRQIDRLNDKEQQIMQAASVAGQEFSSATVAAAVGVNATTVEKCCETLAGRQHFLRPLGYSEWPDGVRAARYGFRHALYQYLWNERVPIGQRQQLHMRIGERLESAYGERASEVAAELAVHFEEGRDHERAVRYLQQAAETAVRRSAYRESIDHLRKALFLFRVLPGASERPQQELALQVSLGVPLLMSRGYTDAEVETTYARARELCQKVGQTPQLFQVLHGLRRFYFAKGNLSIAHELGEQFLRLAQNERDPVFVLWGYRLLGETLSSFGELTLAQEHLEQGLTQDDLQDHRLRTFMYGYDNKMGGLYVLARVLWLRGYPDQARKRNHEASALASEVAHPFSLAAGLNYAAVVHQFCGETHIVKELAEKAITLSLEQGFPFWEASGRIRKGWVLVEEGQEDEGLIQFQHGLTFQRRTGVENSRSYMLSLLAEAYGKVGRIQAGIEAIDEAFATGDRNRDVVFKADLYRLKGDLTLKKFRVQDARLKVSSKSSSVSRAQVEREAEEYFQKGVEIAREQNAKSLELRAVTSLARLWHSQGKKKPAYKILAETYDWFTEGFDTRDLREARALLEELR